MSIDQALNKLLPDSDDDLSHYISAFPTHLLLRVEQVKGSSGGATGNVEYVGFAPAGALKTQPRWLIKKNIYDSTGFQTQSLFANGEALFNKVFDDGSSNYANFTYTTT